MFGCMMSMYEHFELGNYVQLGQNDRVASQDAENLELDPDHEIWSGDEETYGDND